MKKSLKQRITDWVAPRWRMWKIYNELGYVPWRKPRKEKKERKPSRGVYMGAAESIPFLNEDAKRTFRDLLLRPGYLMRDYILRGRHEHYLAPFTSLLVFYSVFALLLAVVNPGSAKDSFSDSLLRGIEAGTSAATMDVDVEVNGDTLSQAKALSLVQTMRDAIFLTRLDLYPEEADTPWKESLAAIEGSIRSKGIPLFLGGFLLLWISMAILLRKYQISFSGAAAASGYIMCQFCIFMFLSLVLSFGGKTELGLLLMGALLFIDYYQLLHLRLRKIFSLTVKTGLLMLAFCILFYFLLGVGLVFYAFARVS